jgi:hypothetical protein
MTEHGKGWGAKLSFTFEVNHNGELSTGDDTWVFPLNMGATFSVALTGQFTGTGNRKENIEFDQSLKKLAEDSKLALECSERGQAGRFARLGGYLGIDDLIERAHLSRGEAYDDYSKLTYDLEFTIKKNASLTPRFSLVPIGKEKFFTGSMKWAGTRTDTQKLGLTFTAPDEPKKPASCAVVPLDPAGWPDPSTCPTVVYRVDAKPAPCKNLNKTQCEARSQLDTPPRLKCTWVKAGEEGACTAPGVAASDERARGSFVARSPRSTGPTSGSGLDPADKAKLDNAQTRSLLQDIQSDVARQRLGN